MEKLNRKPFQGTLNIICFNWHFYLVALLVVLLLQLPGFINSLLQSFDSQSIHQLFGDGSLYQIVGGKKIFDNSTLDQAVITVAGIFSIIIIWLVLISLAVSAFIYDLSNLYKLDWIKVSQDPRRIINIHAGFDETSVLIKNKFPSSGLRVFDFYDPAKHTEVSVKRTRKAYPAFPGTQSAITDELPIPDVSADLVLLLFSAHEIREKNERIRFFSQLKSCLTDDGKILVAEHLRDIPNFLAYSFGFFHFHSSKSWKECFTKAGFQKYHTQKINPFITLYTLQKNGNSY